MDRTEREAKIEEYASGFDRFTAALAEIPREAWAFAPTPGEWCIHEIIVHMADSEWHGALRLRKVIAEPGSTLMPYAEARWAQGLDYRDQDADEALQGFRLARQSTYHLLKRLPDEAFSRSGVHPELDEPYSVDLWLTIYANHVPEHIDQMKRIHQAWREQHG